MFTTEPWRCVMAMRRANRKDLLRLKSLLEAQKDS